MGACSMFVCICRNVKESDLVNAINQGAASFEDIQTATGVASCCGQCNSVAQEITSDLLTPDIFYSAA